VSDTEVESLRYSLKLAEQSMGRRIAELETLLRRMLCSNEMSNGWKDEIQAALRQK
jgi:hypothetical protein